MPSPIPFNELNRILDLGFKPLPWGNTGFIPSTYQPLSSLPTAEQRKALPTPLSPAAAAAVERVAAVASDLRDHVRKI